MRVMQESRGRPLISMLQEPHLPALQFQRMARSLACWAWMRWSTSSTTMPGSTSTSNSLKSPPSLSPRQIRNLRRVPISVVRRVRADLSGLEVLDLRVGDGFEIRHGRWPRHLLDLHVAVRRLAADDVHLDPLFSLALVVETRVSA